MADLKDGVMVIGGKVIGRSGGGAANCKYKTLTISPSSLNASSKYARYTYAYTNTISGMEDTDWVDVSIISGEYDGNYAVESDTDKVTLYFDFYPKASLTVNVYFMPANESEG